MCYYYVFTMRNVSMFFSVLLLRVYNNECVEVVSYSLLTRDLSVSVGVLGSH